eukprot:7795287-Pyramimonas_sp.AAC.1
MSASYGASYACAAYIYGAAEAWTSRIEYERGRDTVRPIQEAEKAIVKAKAALGVMTEEEVSVAFPLRSRPVEIPTGVALW